MPAAIATIPEGRLRLTRSPVALLAAAALKAQEDAGLTAADFIVLAVDVGAAGDSLTTQLQRVTDEHIAANPPARA